jgi:hypothetical protein
MFFFNSINLSFYGEQEKEPGAHQGVQPGLRPD